MPATPFENWRFFEVEHVIPLAWQTTCGVFGLVEWIDDVKNLRLSCLACKKALSKWRDIAEEAVISSLRSSENLLIGETQAYHFRLRLGLPMKIENQKPVKIEGRDLATGLPRTTEFRMEALFRGILSVLKLESVDDVQKAKKEYASASRAEAKRWFGENIG